MKTFKTCLIAVTILVGLTLSAAAQTYTFTEWPTPSASSQPLHLAVINNTQFLFTESAKNRIGYVNVNTNEVTEWLLPNGSMPHSIALDGKNNLAFCAFGGNYVGVFNPLLAKKQLTTYAVPTAGSGPIHLDTQLDATGKPEYFFSEAVGNKIGLLDPPSGTITEWAVPTLSSTPRGVSIGLGPQVFFVELATHKIGMLNTSNNTITEWDIPGVRQIEHLHYANNGDIYFGDLATSVVGTLDPSTNTVTEWTAPTKDAFIPDVFISGSNMYFSERGAGKIGFLNASGQNGTTKVITPVVTPETPVVTPVTPNTATLKATTTLVTPTVTNVDAVNNGGFSEWTIPTSDSGPLGIVGQLGGGTPIFFTEYYGSKVAEFAPAN